ncbi:MAG: TPM domain-containing protein [Opitutae bacterium]|nr:TPM domain-containing protein [Opitutae bacterium]
MKKFFVLLAALTVSALRAAEPAHVTDPGRMLPADMEQAVEVKLADFERETGIRLLVRLHAKSPTEEEDKVPGAYMQALADKLSTRERGVLVVYFADDPDWRVWIGDELTARFAGQAGTVAELTANKAIHNAKEAVFATAKAQADAVEKNLKSQKHLAAEAEALLDGLKQRLAK